MAHGFLRVVSESDLQAQEAEAAAMAEDSQSDVPFSEQFTSDLAHFVRTTFDEFKRHQTTVNLRNRMTHCLRTYNGEYSPSKLQEIRSFGGSDVFARLTAIKCRGATAILRDVYLTGERPWIISATPVPDVPDDIRNQIDILLNSEVDHLIQAGQEVDPQAIAERRKQLLRAADDAAQKEARERAKDASSHLQDRLVEGGAYDALAEFLIDLPIFPYAVMKGPEFKLVRTVKWEDGQPKETEEARMTWSRVSPFDIYWTPGASSLAEADVIERLRLRRSDLQSMMALPGYDADAIEIALDEYQAGLYDHLDESDSERADLESRENPALNRSRMIDALRFVGEVPGKMLQTWNDGKAVQGIENFNPTLDYNVECFLVGRHCIKAQVMPNPRIRHNYYMASFERVSGSIVGRGLPEILEDSQHVANAAFRHLVNNMGIASGPQVAINEDRMSPTTSDSMYPWKRWRFQSDPMGSTEKPIDFFQPNSNAQELLGIFQRMMDLSDEVSGIPRYMTGNQDVSGAAATASGLNQLMNNASKVLQQVASQIDKDVIKPVLTNLYEWVLLTDTDGLTWGDVNIEAAGVTQAMARDADRQRQLEFLQLTANPMDYELIGPRGRATILRELSDNLGLAGEQIVPTEAMLRQKEEEAMRQQAMMMEQAAQAQGAQPKAPGRVDNRPNRGIDNQQRTRTPRAIANQATP
jgi:hypothetical protein